MLVNVNIAFDVKGEAEAKKTIESWKLPEGARVLYNVIGPPSSPQVVGPGGKLTDAPEPPAPPGMPTP
jgi:hypothetical protein